MKFHTEYLTFNTKKHREYVHITPEVESALRKSGIQEGMVLVSAMHITAGVYVNDNESGLIDDIDKWLEEIAPFREDYEHHRTGETQWRLALEVAAGASRSDRAGDGREAGPRPMAGDLLRGVRRPAQEAADHQGDGGIKAYRARSSARQAATSSRVLPTLGGMSCWRRSKSSKPRPINSSTYFS